MPTSDLNNLTRQDLRRLAGEQYFARGEAYFRKGRVRGLMEYKGKVTAKVEGTEDYRVKLWADKNGISYSCSCPLGEDEEFCKHCVAVGLAWIEERREKSVRGADRKSAATIDDVRLFLERQDKGRLVEILLNEAMESDRLRERLFLETARLNPEQVDLATYRRTIKNVMRAGEHVDYYHASGYARGIRRVVEAISALLADGHPVEVIELTEYALSRMEESLGYVDDSDGRVGEVIGQLQELHHRACQQAEPNAIALARKLFEWEMRSKWEFFSGAAECYADVLGPKGLAEYRRLAEAEWAGVPALRAGEDDAERYGRRFRITRIMEMLAQKSDDVEELIAIKSRDLSHSYAYLDIAETYRAAGRHNEALDWAERGWKAFPEGRDWRLGEFLADGYHGRGRHDEAMNLIWKQFKESSDLDNYRKLRSHAHKAGRSAWAQWRERALTHLRAAVPRTQKQGRRTKAFIYGREADRSELVRIFLWEKRYEEAWQEACAGGCTDDLWMQLAALREADHPQDALSIYRESIAPLIEMTDNTAYERAIELLHKVHKLMQRLGRQTEFDDYLATLKVEYKRKRNFIKLLGEVVKESN